MRIAILGLGSIGRRHLANVRRLMPHAELVGIDPSLSARKWAMTAGATEVFETLEPALATEPDAAMVCSPTGLHAEQLRACVVRTIPAYVEKPIAARLTPNLVETLRQADAVGCPVVVAANLRYAPGAALLSQRVEDGQYGRLVGLYAHAGAYLPGWKPNRELRDYRDSYSASAQEGGAMRDFAHEFDLLRWWGGSVRAVTASVRRASDLEIMAEDVADILLEFESGASGTLHVDYLERCPRRFIQLLFTDGGAVWDLTSQRVEVVDAAGRPATALDMPRYDLDECYTEGFAGFLRAIACPGEDRRVQTGWDGAEALAVIDAARESAERRGRVEVGEIRRRCGLGRNSEFRIQDSETGVSVHERSQALLARAGRVIPSATQTLSKGL